MYMFILELSFSRSDLSLTVLDICSESVLYLFWTKWVVRS